MAQVSRALKVGKVYFYFCSGALPMTEISCPVSGTVLTAELSFSGGQVDLT